MLEMPWSVNPNCTALAENPVKGESRVSEKTYHHALQHSNDQKKPEQGAHDPLCIKFSGADDGQPVCMYFPRHVLPEGNGNRM